MSVIAGKHALLALLRREGVEIMFGNPGTTELTLMDAFVVESEPRYVLALHEGVGMSMAHGYAAASGKLVAINLHAAPGLGNAMGMLYNAKKAGVPILVTAGQHDTKITLTEPLLWDDLPVLARPLVKWSTQVQTLAELPRAIHRAAKVAMTPPMGPVFLSIPDDILTESTELGLMGSTRIGLAIRGDKASIEHAAVLIAAAKKPLVFAGDCVAQRHAHAELIELVELIGAPVYAEAMADTASFPSTHPMFAGLVARLGPAVNALVQQHDLVISIGGDLFTQSLPTGVDPIAPGTKIVHLDVDPWELGKNYETEAAIFGDPKATLPELIAEVRARMSADTLSDAEIRTAQLAESHFAQRRKWVEQAIAAEEVFPIQPLALLHQIGQILPDDAVVVEEILSSNPGLRHLIKSDDPQSYYGLRGGGIGMAIPQAVGAQLALPERPVVALVGDGSALYSFQALWTAAHEKLPVVFIIFNNRSYRILKQRTKRIGDHTARTGEYVAMDLIDPEIDFVSLATSFGVAAVAVDKLTDFAQIFRAALAAKKPFLIDVRIDKTV